MGTKVDSKSYFPGYYSMRDLNEDSSSSSWPICYGDKAISNGQYYNGFMPRTAMDGYPGYGKDALKQTMLEHEAVFKNQVSELHRVYRIQRDMMEEYRRKELRRIRPSIEPLSSSSLGGPQVALEDARKWHMTGFPMLNSNYERTSISGVEITNSPMSCTKGNTDVQPGQFPFQNGSSSVKDSELLDSRPMKVRKKLFDLELPADEYIGTDEGKESPDCKGSDVSSYAPNGNLKSGPETQKLSPVGHIGATTECRIDASASGSCFRNPVMLADLNEPIDVEEATAPSSTNIFGHGSINRHTNGVNQHAMLNAGYLGANAKTVNYREGLLTNSSVESKANERGPLSHIYEAGSSRSNFYSVIPSLQQDKSHPMQCMLNPHDQTPGIYLTRHSQEDSWREGAHHHLESSDRSRDQSNNRFMGPHMASHAPGSDPFFSSSYYSGTWAHGVPSWAKPAKSFTQIITAADSRLNPAAAMDRGVQISGEPVSSWAKPAKCFTQMMTATDSSLTPAAAMDRGLQISAEWQKHCGGNRRVGDDFMLNPGLGGELSTWNGFYHGSASGSKEMKAHIPSSGFDYRNCSRGKNVVSDHMTSHGYGHFPRGSSFADSKPPLDINLNEVVSKSSYNEVMVLPDVATVDDKSKPEGHRSSLPWLNNTPARANDAANSRSYVQDFSNQLSCKAETVRDLNEPFTPIIELESNEMKTTRNQNVKKILGFPIFEAGDLKSELFSHVSNSASFSCPRDGNGVVKERKNRVIDINLECEPEEEVVVNEKQTKCGVVRDFIDLNSCITDCEDALAPSYESKTVKGKVILDIDLESPVLPEKESNEDAEGAAVSLLLENKTDSSQDEALRTAAEAIIAMSSSCPKIHPEESAGIDILEASLAESFMLFVNAVSSCPDESMSTDKDGLPKDLSEEMDDFEAMTLQIPETGEEDYMPTPFVPELQKNEEAGGNTVTRPRRGQARRGRQRRDFQRDILPGLTSLSRHEVTEDIQTFGGMMRATGHHWVSGLARRNGTRNGGGRGRRRAVVETVPAAAPTPTPTPTPLIQQLNSIEAGLEDRSLTGWGKTPRRPRRQRCPAAGNPTAVVLT
ncbi:hypothetical protein SASPL_107814 [Salvia splendens]|uniref:Uncharacterized protein n=2 Tax=Salvia splendens TaxID=180675 RepID=A0A8X9A6U8_SALSN|nr:uncharacterized protein LOC121794866 isoform X1 [Salvia splendens]KAG6429761.1 hypothetical protein SASPL_107814 [Salvia splendens]